MTVVETQPPYELKVTFHDLTHERFKLFDIEKFISLGSHSFYDKNCIHTEHCDDNIAVITVRNLILKSRL